MSHANIKLTVSFEFELAAPEQIAALSHEQLCRHFSQTLGKMVLQGMPTVTRKQLAAESITLLKHHHHLDVAPVGGIDIDRELLIAAAPHLTDDELDQLAAEAGRKKAVAPEALPKALRRLALQLVNEFRLVPCEISGTGPAGEARSVRGQLNLTNGCVLVDKDDRSTRLRAGDDAVSITPAGTTVSMRGHCAGHTLSGPVMEVPIDRLAAQRDALIRAWQSAA